MEQVDDLRIEREEELISPSKLQQQLPVTEKAAATVAGARRDIHRILNREDDRLLVVVGPCSIHDVKAAREYADRLLAVREQFDRDLLLVMRVYFEKPRTTVGWKGLINDPGLNDSFRINDGLQLARHLLLDLAEKGLPAGTEFLDLISPQYVAELVSWGAIGARTTESQGHRELASGLSCPVGFKNSTDGSLQVAVDAIGSAARPHSFLSVTKEGHSAIFRTRGNPDCHIILRGGAQPNYDAAGVDDASALLQQAGLPERVMIDASHANSRKNPTRQRHIARNIGYQLSEGERRIIGVMIEGHLKEGAQKVVAGQEDAAEYGVSITDPCLGWDDTVVVLEGLAESVRHRRGQ